MGLTNVLTRTEGVVVGEDVHALYSYARQHNFAIPAIASTPRPRYMPFLTVFKSVSSSSSTVAVLEAARASRSPIIVSISQKSSAFYAGQGLSNVDQSASVAGAIAFAYHVRAIAALYHVPVVLHTDHCKKAHLPWLDGILQEDQRFYDVHHEPLFSSHMIDLSEEPVDVNLETCKFYFQRMRKMNQWLEIELGLTGSEKDGLNDRGEINTSLYTRSEDILCAYTTLSAIGPLFQIAAAFGNVHGVYQPGNVKLKPEILGKHQEAVRNEMDLDVEKPLFLVMHGGSGSTHEEYKAAIFNGVVKINIDTDTQYSYLSGVRDFVVDNLKFLRSAFGNSDNGDNRPRKAFFDPRVWLRRGEEVMMSRICEKLAAFNTAQQL